MGLLPAEKIIDGHLIIRVALRCLSHVDEHSLAEQTIQRDLIDGLMALGEMDWRVDVRPAVLGRRKVVRRVVIAACSYPIRDLLEPERLRGGPEDGLPIVRMRQIHDSP